MDNVFWKVDELSRDEGENLHRNYTDDKVPLMYRVPRFVILIPFIDTVELRV